MIRQSSSTALSTPPGCRYFIRTTGNIGKVKYRLRRKKRVTARKLLIELGISDRSVRQIMKNAVRLHPYKIVTELLLSDDEWKKSANWVRTNFRNESIIRILFSDEKFFDIDGV